MQKSTDVPVIVIPNLNGGEALLEAVRSLVEQSLKPQVIVVDNASTDGSPARVAATFPEVEIIYNQTNRGYAGGVNPGLRRGLERGAGYVGVFNDDAVAEPGWLAALVSALDEHPTWGAADGKILTADGRRFDSSGDLYTNWGLPHPRGRGETDAGQYDEPEEVFAASGAAALYRAEALQKVGLFDEDFFAYYEDIDLSFRLQLAGYRIGYVPKARVRHAIGQTSSKMKGFTTYQTMKNLRLVAIKNVPGRYFWRVYRRLLLAQTLFLGRAVSRGHGLYALKGLAKSCALTPKKLKERRQIQKSAVAAPDYIWGIITHNLPPDARALRRLRRVYRRLTLKKEA